MTINNRISCLEKSLFISAPIAIRILALFLAACIIGVNSSWAVDPIGEMEAKILAENAVRVEVAPASLFIRATRRMDLEDDLFKFQRKIRGKIAKYAYIFQATDVGYEIISPDEFGLHFSSGPRKWLIAVSPLNRNVYGLRLFSKGEESFNRLALDADLVFQGESDIEDYIKFYLECFGYPYGKLLGSHLGLYHEVEDFLYAKGLSFQKWKKRYESSGVRPTFGIKALKSSDGYSALCSFFVIPKSKTPTIKEISFTVTEEGCIKNINVRQLYPILK